MRPVEECRKCRWFQQATCRYIEWLPKEDTKNVHNCTFNALNNADQRTKEVDKSE